MTNDELRQLRFDKAGLDLERDDERMRRLGIGSAGVSRRHYTSSRTPGRQVHAYLASTAPVARVLHNDGSVSLYSNGRLLMSRASRESVDRRSRQILA